MPDFHEYAFCSLDRTEILFDYRLRSTEPWLRLIVTHSFRTLVYTKYICIYRSPHLRKSCGVMHIEILISSVIYRVLCLWPRRRTCIVRFVKHCMCTNEGKNKKNRKISEEYQLCFVLCYLGFYDLICQHVECASRAKLIESEAE